MNWFKIWNPLILHDFTFWTVFHGLLKLLCLLFVTIDGYLYTFIVVCNIRWVGISIKMHLRIFMHKGRFCTWHDENDVFLINFALWKNLGTSNGIASSGPSHIAYLKACLSLHPMSQPLKRLATKNLMPTASPLKRALSTAQCLQVSRVGC